MKTLHKKGEGEITRLGIAVIVLAMFVSSILFFLVSVEDNYDLGVDDTQFKTFQTIDTLQGNLSLPTGENIEEGTGEFSAESYITGESMLRSGTKSFKLFLSIPNILSNLIVDSYYLSTIEGGLGIPNAYFFGSIALIVMIVIISLVAIIFKVKA